MTNSIPGPHGAGLIHPSFRPEESPIAARKHLPRHETGVVYFLQVALVRKLDFFLRRRFSYLVILGPRANDFEVAETAIHVAVDIHARSA
jgi:hypothetical protein